MAVSEQILRLPPPHMQGDLLLRDTSWFKPAWKKIYAMTLADRLEVSVNEDEFERRNIMLKFNLDKVQIHETVLTRSRKKFVFKIITQDGEEFYFACKSSSELSDWSKKLQTLVSYWKRKMVAEKIKQEYDGSENTTNNDGNVMKVNFPQKVMGSPSQQSSSQFMTSVILDNNKEKVIALDKEAKFQALFFEISKDGGCPNCKMCKFRSENAQLYVVKPDGQVCHVRKDESLYSYHKSNSEFHLVESKNKLLVAYFEDNTFIVSHVAMTITVAQLLTLKPIQNKQHEIGCHNVGVFYQSEGRQSGFKESLLNCSEELITYFYDAEGAPLSICGKLIVKDKTLRRKTMLDLDKMRSAVNAAKERAKLKDRDFIKAAVEAEKSGKSNPVVQIMKPKVAGNPDSFETYRTNAVPIPHRTLVKEVSVNFNPESLDVETCSPFIEALPSSVSSCGSVQSYHSIKSNGRSSSIRETLDVSPSIETSPDERPGENNSPVFDFEGNTLKQPDRPTFVESKDTPEAVEENSQESLTSFLPSTTSNNDSVDNSQTGEFVENNDSSVVADKITTADPTSQTPCSEVVDTMKPTEATDSTECSSTAVAEEPDVTSKVHKQGKSNPCQICSEMVGTKPHYVKTSQLMSWVLSGQCDYICLRDLHLRHCNGKWDFCDDTTPEKRGMEDSWDQFIPSQKHNVTKFNMGNNIICSFVKAERRGSYPEWVVKRIEGPINTYEVPNPVEIKIDIPTTPVVTSSPLDELDDSSSCEEEPKFMRPDTNPSTVAAIKHRFSEKAKIFFTNFTQNQSDKEDADLQPALRRQSLSNTLKERLHDAKAKAVTKAKIVSVTISNLQSNLEKANQIPTAENEYIMPNELIEVRSHYILPLESVVSKICEVFEKSDLNESDRIGDDSLNPNMGWLVRSNMCTLIASFLSIGLKQNLLKKTFFKSKLVSMWSLVKDMSLSFQVPQLDSIIREIENCQVLENDNMRFRQFFCEMLNRSTDDGDEKLIVLWFQRFPLSTHTEKYYVDHSFWRMNYNMMFCVLLEEIVISLKLLTGLPFNLKMNFELNQQTLARHYCNTGSLNHDVAHMLE